MHSPAWRLDRHLAGLELHSWRLALDVARPDQGLLLHGVDPKELAPHGQATEFQEKSAAGLRILGVELSDRTAGDATVSECYVRGLDLVATYAIPALATRVQVYWRAVSDALRSDVLDGDAGTSGAVTAIDLQISVQTDVLDASPRVSTRSVLPSDRVERLLDSSSPTLKRILMPIDADAPVSLVPDGAPACLLFPLRGGELVYVEMVHPADFRQCQVSRRGENLIVEHCLFAEKDLEKGVIMRARVRGLLLRSAALRAAGNVTAIVAEAYERFVAAAPPLTT